LGGGNAVRYAIIVLALLGVLVMLNKSEEDK